MKDKELINKCKANNYAAQMQVYNSYKRMLYNASWRIFKNKQDAEDAVQDAFIKGFQKIHQLKDDANLGAWLKRIIINRSLDVIRKRTQIWVDDVIIEDTEVEEPFSEDDSISIDFIKNCIDGLAEKYRIILILYLIEDYTHREISEQLNLKESTVRNQYRRGKTQLLKLIETRKTHEFKTIHTE
ncbi:RNA polymerase sigma factor [Pontimicrobium sp. SW4]|uniref:RNA polymerase sigma factor n=1 Tax=Pontimicrobium sp. SW4 TaxID=3153519 RepID=A0AAU7BVJ2_9FLAO